jgi:hypothetical protein
MVAAAPWSRGGATAGPLCGKVAVTPGPLGGQEVTTLQRQSRKRRPRRASSDGVARGARFERHHRRREVHAATVVRDILRSGVVRAARVTTSIRSRVVDDVLQRLPPLIHIVFRFLCFMPTTCTIYAKNVRFYTWTRSSYISLLHAYILHAHWKSNSLIYAVCNYHKNICSYLSDFYVCHKTVSNSHMFVINIKNQIKSLMFAIARFLHLP